MTTLNTDIELKPSLIFISGLLLVWILASIIIFTLPIAALVKALLFIVAVLYTRQILKHHGLLSHKNSVKSLQLQDSLWYTNRQPAILLGDSTVTRWISILRFQCPTTKKLKVSIVLPDSMKEISYRQLVMRLRAVDILAHEIDENQTSGNRPQNPVISALLFGTP